MRLFNTNHGIEPEVLAETAMFRDLTSDELAAVSKVAVRREIAAGEAFIEQGRFGLEYFVIAEGTANVFIGNEHITSISTGASVGEMALIEHRPRSASIVAETDMVVAEFALKDFNKMLEKNPSAKLRIMEVLNARVSENLGRKESE